MDSTGKCVTHPRFGDGVIKSCENGMLQIVFGEYGARNFHYPEAFERFLRTEDGELEAEVAQDLSAFRKTQEAQNLRVAEAYAELHLPVKPAKAPRAKTTRAPRKPAAKKI
jgi:hypothetical protein